MCGLSSRSCARCIGTTPSDNFLSVWQKLFFTARNWGFSSFFAENCEWLECENSKPKKIFLPQQRNSEIRDDCIICLPVTQSLEPEKQIKPPVLVTYKWRLRRTRSLCQASSIVYREQLHTCFKVLFKPHIRSYLLWLRASLSFFSKGNCLSYKTCLTSDCRLWGITDLASLNEGFSNCSPTSPVLRANQYHIVQLSLWL